MDDATSGTTNSIDQVIVGGGSRDRKVLVPPASLVALPGAEVVKDLARPVDPGP